MTADMTARSVCWWLSRDPAQVRHARGQARAALSRWGLGEHADLAELIVSELATNAICHGHGAIRVCVSYARRHLRVAVHDDGAGRPARQQPAPDDECGRGLALLDSLIGLHGGRREVATDSTGHGKTVHVTICPSADPAGHPEQGWNLLANGIITLDDTAALLPDRTAIERAHRAVRGRPRPPIPASAPRLTCAVGARPAGASA